MSDSHLELTALPADLDRLYSAKALVFVVSGYDGSGNFGDIVMAEEDVTAIAAAGDIVPVLVADPRNVERVECHRATSAALQRAVVLFAGLRDAVLPATDRLLPVEVPPPVPTALVLAGGGYVNERWGLGRLDMLAAVQAWLATAENPRSHATRPFLLGLQVSPAAFEGELGARFAALVESASAVGLRDPGSLDRVLAAFPTLADRVSFSGDDATFALVSSAPACSDAISLHLSWKLHSDESARLVIEALRLVRGIPPRVNLVAGHEDLYVSETEQQDNAVVLLKQAGLDVERLAGWEQRDALVDAVAAGALTIACSYHVALTSLLNGVPAILVAEDAYYLEKHTGLARLFGLPSEFVVDAGRTAPAVLAATIERALGPESRAALAPSIQRGALQLAAARARTVQALQATLRSIVSDVDHQELDETTAELMRMATRLAELRRANNAMVTEAQRAIESARSPVDPEALARIEHLSTQLALQGQQLMALEAASTVKDHHIEHLETALALSQQHIRNLEAALNTKASRLARLGVRAVNKLPRRS